MLDTDLPAACMTERELADAIKIKYRKFLVEPFVTVAVREYNANPIAVIGAVNSPGRFQLQRKIHLIELLTFVNGPSTNAGHTVEILRNLDQPFCDGASLVAPDRSGEPLLSLNLSEVFKGGGHENPQIRPGDIVRIASAEQLNAYIQGNVMKSSAIPLTQPVTLTQAIAMAGGVSPGAELEKVLIRRPISGSLNRNLIVANVKEINLQKREDILLQPNDIIEVPGPTGARKVFRDIYKTLVPTLTNLPTRVIY
jgi:polysaccharide export outer membrane protein